METRIKLLGHPVHPKLIVLPLRLGVGVDADAALEASDSLTRHGPGDGEA